jgi:hypothetical protein
MRFRFWFPRWRYFARRRKTLRCSASTPQGIRCTERDGHLGAHQAVVAGTAYVWDNGDWPAMMHEGMTHTPVPDEHRPVQRS